MVYGYPAIACHPSYRSDLPDHPGQTVHGFCLKMTHCPWRFLRLLSTSRPDSLFDSKAHGTENGDGVPLVAAGVRSYSLCSFLTTIKRSWTMRPLEILVNRAETIAHESKRPGCQDLSERDQAIKFI